MSLVAFLGAVELGLIYGLVALGVYLSFRVLSFPDLTVDGSFPLGAAVVATAITGGLNAWLGTALALAAGAAAGLVTAILNVRFRILHLLASILTMIALYSINLRIMGRPNIALLGETTVLTPFEQLGLPLALGAAAGAAGAGGGVRGPAGAVPGERDRARDARHRRQPAHGRGAGHPRWVRSPASAWR